MARRTTLCTLLAALSLSISSPVFSYDKNDSKISNATYEKIKEPIVEVQVGAEVPCKEIPFHQLDPGDCIENDVVKNYAAGSAILLQDKKGLRYVLTASHLFPAKMYKMEVTVDGSPAWIMDRDMQKDLALLQVTSDGMKKKEAFEGCFGEDFDLSDYVIGVAFTDDVVSVAHGRIHSITPSLWTARDFVHTGGITVSGNSGGILYAFQEGQPIGIGILVTGGRGGLGGVVSSYLINNFLSSIPSLQHYACTKEETKMKKK